MKKEYDATGDRKREIIEADNLFKAFDRSLYQKDYIGIRDMLLVGRVKSFPLNSFVDIHWSINGLLEDSSNLGDFIIIEPLAMHINELANIDEVDTFFNESIKLSKKAIVLMPSSKYNEIYENVLNVRSYKGEDDLAVKMLFLDKNYIYLNVTKNGYNLEPDVTPYATVLLEQQKKLVEKLQKEGKNVTFGKRTDFFYVTQNDMAESVQSSGTKGIEQNIKLSDPEGIVESVQPSDTKGMAEKIQHSDTNKKSNYKMITGLTKKVEGEAQLDDELYAATDIGKARENQEDAVLIIKDPEIPKFKMLVVADGMGGWQHGEIASDDIVHNLKDWFENLTPQEKQCYFTGTYGLRDSLLDRIKREIQPSVEYKTSRSGGSTLVCAIIGENDTLIANIGDSRAYAIKDGKLHQLSREDTVAQENFEKGKTPSKEASRFDEEANILLQCIGMYRADMNNPHFEVVNNKDYDMLLLFTDGVTDCLSDDDIAIVCKNSNRQEVCKKIVEKALNHDSIVPEEYDDYTNLTRYIPGGKDNTTAAVYVPKKDEELSRE